MKKRDKIEQYCKNRNINMSNEQGGNVDGVEQQQSLQQQNLQEHGLQQNLLEQLEFKNQQLNRMAAALQELQIREQSHQQRERVMKEVRYMSTFTGKSEVTINSFISSVEYYLQGITDISIRKCMVRAIYYEKIQGEAKETIINIPHPDDWDTIKAALKSRYKPDIEPAEIYRKISALRINTVSELVLEIQNIKYKADELQIYYNDSNYIDLSNVNTFLVNTIKEMAQGTLLDRIFEEKDLDKIINIINKRKFEDACIRPEFKRSNHHFNSQNRNKNLYENKFNNSNQRKNNTQNNSNNSHAKPNNLDNFYNRPKFQNTSNYKQFSRNCSQNNNSGQYRQQNYNRQDNQNYSNSRQFNRNYHNNNSGQYRKGLPMEVENIQQVSNSNSKSKNEAEANNVEFFMN